MCRENGSRKNLKSSPFRALSLPSVDWGFGGLGFITLGRISTSLNNFLFVTIPPRLPPFALISDAVVNEETLWLLPTIPALVVETTETLRRKPVLALFNIEVEAVFPAPKMDEDDADADADAEGNPKSDSDGERERRRTEPSFCRGGGKRSGSIGVRFLSRSAWESGDAGRVTLSLRALFGRRSGEAGEGERLGGGTVLDSRYAYWFGKASLKLQTRVRQVKMRVEWLTVVPQRLRRRFVPSPAPRLSA